MDLCLILQKEGSFTRLTSALHSEMRLLRLYYAFSKWMQKLSAMDQQGSVGL